MSYWDTSALLKLFAAEPDSPVFEERARQESLIACSAIVSTEMLCAMYRKEQLGDLTRGGARMALHQFQLDLDSGRILTIPYGQDVAIEAEKVVKAAFGPRQQLPLRSLDAIHVASALVAKSKVIVATDARLRNVAAFVGIAVYP
ncbi:MAG: type II toxin-antitoxin system VapC family toxin [Acidobacteria bacterium]|nr:type II toxin-antitoxin system VapC family toxin [Acidobacteriota bacterium]